MSKRKHYSPEYKRELVELVRRSQSSCRKIALEVGINPNMLTRWVREADAGSGKAFPGGGIPRDEEVARLKRELSRVTKERDFLKDAAAVKRRGRSRAVVVAVHCPVRNRVHTRFSARLSSSVRIRSGTSFARISGVG